VPPAGWTQRATGGNGGLWTANADVASTTWTVTGSQSIAGWITAFSGVNRADPVPSGGTSSATGTGTTATATSVTGAAGGLLFALFGNNAGGAATWTPPGGMTERRDGLNAESVDEQLTASGATGTRAAVATLSANWVALMVALRATAPSKVLAHGRLMGKLKGLVG
jgi:hypothetical protein